MVAPGAVEATTKANCVSPVRSVCPHLRTVRARARANASILFLTFIHPKIAPPRSLPSLEYFETAINSEDNSSSFYYENSSPSSSPALPPPLRSPFVRSRETRVC